MANSDIENRYIIKLEQRIEILENRCAQFDLHFMSLELQIGGPGEILKKLKQRVAELENQVLHISGRWMPGIP